ncbi:hypothetical protein EBR25_05785 [bacterium]|jgi:diacylglycerol kinase family enzyme|nr:hypothetical protein [bacterium]
MKPSSTKRLLAIINYNSGSGSGYQLKDCLQQLAQRHGYSLLILSPQEASALPDEDWHQFDKYIIAGGDGTLSQQICRFAGSTIAFHIVPLGTGNDLAREFGLSHLSTLKEQELEAYILGEKTRNMQIWECSFPQTNEVPIRFMNYFSIGLEAAVIKKFSMGREKQKAWFGSRIINRLLYARYTLQELKKGKTIIVNQLISESNKQTQTPKHLLSICFTNLSSLMGLGWQKPRGNPEDMLIEVRFMQSIWNYFKTMSPLGKQAPYAEGCKWALHLENEIESIQFDGEPKQLTQPVRSLDIRPLGAVHISLFPKT